MFEVRWCHSGVFHFFHSMPRAFSCWHGRRPDPSLFRVRGEPSEDAGDLLDMDLHTLVDGLLGENDNEEWSTGPEGAATHGKRTREDLEATLAPPPSTLLKEEQSPPRQKDGPPQPRWPLLPSRIAPRSEAPHSEPSQLPLPHLAVQVHPPHFSVQLPPPTIGMSASAQLSESQHEQLCCQLAGPASLAGLGAAPGGTALQPVPQLAGSVVQLAGYTRLAVCKPSAPGAARQTATPPQAGPAHGAAVAATPTDHSDRHHFGAGQAGTQAGPQAGTQAEASALLPVERSAGVEGGLEVRTASAMEPSTSTSQSASTSARGDRAAEPRVTVEPTELTPLVASCADPYVPEPPYCTCT